MTLSQGLERQAKDTSLALRTSTNFSATRLRCATGWTRISSYGGKFFENACQAVAGDVLKIALPKLEVAGYETVLTVHDEDVAEAPDTDDYNATAMSAILAEGADWTDGLPLAAAGFETYRYRKE